MLKLTCFILLKPKDFASNKVLPEALTYVTKMLFVGAIHSQLVKKNKKNKSKLKYWTLRVYFILFVVMLWSVIVIFIVKGPPELWAHILKPGGSLCLFWRSTGCVCSFAAVKEEEKLRAVMPLDDGCFWDPELRTSALKAASPRPSGRVSPGSETKRG